MQFKRLRLKALFTLLLINTVFLAMATAGFAARKDKSKGVVMTEIELQSELMSYADRFASIITQAYEDFETLKPSPQARQYILSDVVYSQAAIYTIAAEPNPQVGLLDMAMVTTLGRMIYEVNMRQRYGASTEVLTDGFRQLEEDIWQIAARVLTEAQQAELRQLILLWRKNNPETVVYNYLRFGDFAAQRRNSALAQKVQSGGLFKSVQEVTQQVEETRMLAERGIFLGTRLPLLMGNFAEVWMSQLLMNPQLGKTLADVNRFAAVSERLATVAEQIPEQVSKERYKTINQVSKEMTKHRKATIDQVMQEVNVWTNETLTEVMGQVALERSAAIDQFMNRLFGEQKNALDQLIAEEHRVKDLVSELRLTLSAGNNLVKSATALSEAINLDLSKSEATPVDSRPFDITEYQDTIAEVTKLVATTNQLVGTVGLEKLLPELIKVIDRLEGEGEELIDHSFRQALILILISMAAYVIARLIYNFLHKKLIESKV
jgi:hypothetical protein